MYKVVTAVNPSTRQQALAAAAAGRRPDLIVVGGGVVGCGIAVDASSRGLSVLLLERDDFATGASSASSKLVHGGLRYLEQLDLGLVQEALRERALLLRNAPQLVRPLRFVHPVGRGRAQSAYVRLGLSLYDTLAPRMRVVPRHRRLAAAAFRELAPGLVSAFDHGFEFWDATVDDARLTITLARTAAGLGADLASRVEVTDFLRERGHVAGVVVTDRLSGDELQLRARAVVCAVGADTELLQRRTGSWNVTKLAPSKGAHIVVPGDRIPAETALLTRTADSVLFMIPWNKRWIIGTTDSPVSDPSVRPTVTDDDVAYLLEAANTVLAEPLSTEDVVGGYAGLRPLVAGNGPVRTTHLSREHVVTRDDDGLVYVAGGKLTTYRVMARDAVDAAVRGMGARRSKTHELPLLGQSDARASESRPESLRARYGDLTEEVLELAQSSPELLEPIPGAPDYLCVEALYAVTHEGALELDDVLSRRTHVSIETRDAGLRAAEPVAHLIAPALGWDAARVERELERYRARVQPDYDAATIASANSTARRSISSAS
jgi:glycerol-3-phosphate dehydrogenase